MAKDVTKNRRLLKPLINKPLIVRGTICRIEAPRKDVKHICLSQAVITVDDPEVIQDERESITYDHLWITINQRTHPNLWRAWNLTIASKFLYPVVASAYQRSDKTFAFGIDFKSDELYVTETAVLKRMAKIARMCKSLCTSRTEAAKKLLLTCKQTMMKLESDSVFFINETKSKVLSRLKKRIASLEDIAAIPTKQIKTKIIHRRRLPVKQAVGFG